MSRHQRDEKAIFLSAMEQPSVEQRRRFIENACAGDPALLARVEALLQSHDESRGPLDAPAPGIQPTELPPLTEQPGDHIGSYKLLQQIGEGGMGVVYMAQQTDPVERRVALKIIKPGLDTQQVIARFEAERQALAMMDHPNIAKVLDAGATDTGRPYFVMELVNGVSITEFCDEQHLTPKERLELFLPVCHAVQHAHQKGIIHRDLKPSNILVAMYDDKPVPKVIDFGVAKAVSHKLTEKTMFTQHGQIVGTIEYMSPEQAQFNQLDVDTRSDIYSLGVLLYELLTGETPFDKQRLRSAAFDELLRIIREEEPPRPSTKLSSSQYRASTAVNRKMEPKKLSLLVRGDLDWIVMKALEKDRNRRYDTANALAADVQHYLCDEPVQACPPSAWYRLRKVLRRNRGTAATVCALLAVLVAGIAATTAGFLSARAAQRRAEANFEIAKNAVDDYLNDVTEDPDLKRSDFNVLRKKLLQSAVPFYQRLVQQKPGDAAQEAARGHACARLGDLRRQTGETERALGDFEQMRSIFGKLTADFPHEPEYRAMLGDSHNSIGAVLALHGRYDEADAAFRAALLVQEKLVDDFPAVPEYRASLAETHQNLGSVLSQIGKRAGAEAECRAALEIYEKLAAEFPAAPEYREGLAKTREALGWLLSGLGKRGEAEAAYRAALADREQLADDPTVPENRGAATRLHLGLLLNGLGKPDEAEAAFRAALAIQQKLADDFPTVPEYRENLATTHNKLGLLMTALRRHDEAQAAYRAALAIQQKLADDFPTVPDYRNNLATTHNKLGLLMNPLRRHDEAEAAYRAALTIQQKLVHDFPAVPGYRYVLAHTLNNLACLLDKEGKDDEAQATYRAAMAIYEKLADDDPTLPAYAEHIAMTGHKLGLHLTRLGRRDEAALAFLTEFETWEKLAEDFPAVPEYHRKCRPETCRYLGDFQARKGQWKQAAATFARAVELDPIHEKDAAYRLGILLAEQGELSPYQKYCNTMLSQWGKVSKPMLDAGTAKACLLLPGGVTDPEQLAPLVQSALSNDNELWQKWVLFVQGLHDYRCGRFAEALAACGNSRRQSVAYFPALPIADQIVEAMSLYRLGRTDDARHALAEADRRLAEHGVTLDSTDLGELWHDWLCCRILLREATALIEQNNTSTKQPQPATVSSNHTHQPTGDNTK